MKNTDKVEQLVNFLLEDEDARLETADLEDADVEGDMEDGVEDDVEDGVEDTASSVITVTVKGQKFVIDPDVIKATNPPEWEEIMGLFALVRDLTFGNKPRKFSLKYTIDVKPDAEVMSVNVIANGKKSKAEVSRDQTGVFRFVDEIIETKYGEVLPYTLTGEVNDNTI
jgi:hypothetical protein